jgi:hypothetical protein
VSHPNSKSDRKPLTNTNIGESQSPDPQTSSPWAAPPNGSPPSGATPTSETHQRPNPPPQTESSSPATLTPQIPTRTHTTTGNPPTQRLATTNSGNRSQSSPPPSGFSSVPIIQSTEYQMPTSSPPPTSSNTAIAGPRYSVQEGGSGSHPPIGLILGIVIPVVALLIVALVLFCRRRRVRRIPMVLVDPFSSHRPRAEKPMHSTVSLSIGDGDETVVETYNRASVLSYHAANLDRHPEPDYDRNALQISEEKLRRFTMDRYGALPSNGHSAVVETDDQLPPYRLRNEGE